MKRLQQLKSELAKIRKELDFIEGQLDADAVLGGDTGLGELSDGERCKLYERNEKLITQCIQLEVTLEELED